MAPDRGRGSRSTAASSTYRAIRNDDGSSPSPSPSPSREPSIHQGRLSRDAQRYQQAENFFVERAYADTHFTVRGVVTGLVIGIIVCFSNTYFGLQTGWVSGMAMPAALIGYAFFKSVSRYIDYPFTPVENVLVQTVAGAVGTMPLGVGCVGVLPALNFLLKPSENGPIDLGIWRLIVWSVGICFFGVFIAVPLRKEVITREKLRFPSGTATALMIGVLHGNKVDDPKDDPLQIIRTRSGDASERGRSRAASQGASAQPDVFEGIDRQSDWKAKIRFLSIAFAVSAAYTLISYFFPILHRLPIFGLTLANQWLWKLNPSPAYVGQGIIMGPTTTTHMLLGAILGWAILSPYAKSQGFAPGPVNDWETGSKGWIVWVSLAIMLADAVMNIGWLALRPLLSHGQHWISVFFAKVSRRDWHSLLGFSTAYTPLENEDSTVLRTRSRDSSQNSTSPLTTIKTAVDELPAPDAPPEHLVSNRIVYPGFILSVLLCIAAVHIAFPSIIPLWATILAILFSLVLSLMGVRALGETDLNPVSGISKLTQLAFALLLPPSRNATTINLLAGAISESAALQAGDMMQDLKTGHLLGASPAAQFWGQLLGSLVGAVASALVYRLYASVYRIPDELFPVPTAYVWLFTARLVAGQGLPPGAWRWAGAAGALWCALTAVRIWGTRRGSRWVRLVPGGIAVAVGMYNVPSFTLARAFGGFVSAYWRGWRGGEEETVVVLASGLILGEGVMSIVNLALASLHVPHL